MMTTMTSGGRRDHGIQRQAKHLEEARDSVDRANGELSSRNQELDAARAVAEAATKAKSQFLANEP